MSSPEERCLFCRISRGEIPSRKVFEDESVLAFEDINPQAPTHLLVIPKRHIATLSDLTDADRETMGTLMVRASQIAGSQRLDSEGFRLVVNCGESAGQTVFHIHVHILGGRSFGWPPG